jgi:hypothetical protein
VTNPCSPLSQITSDDGTTPDMWTMIAGLAAIYFVFYSAAWIILALLARKSE